MNNLFALEAAEELSRDGAACVEMQEDLVAVVRCKHCAVERDSHGGCPLLNGLVTPPDFYCANGIKGETK